MSCRSFPAADAGHGVTRRVLADSPELMVVEFAFGPGAEGPPHSHPHVQSTYVLSGRYAFTICAETFKIGPGDALTVPSGAKHACRALEPGVLIDSFAPRRDDFF